MGDGGRTRGDRKPRGADRTDRTKQAAADEWDAGPITWAEKAGAVLLLAVSLAVGIYPRVLLDWIEAGLGSAGFAALRRTMGWP